MDFKQRLWREPLERNTSEAVNITKTFHHHLADYARAALSAIVFHTRSFVEFFEARDL